MLVTNKNTNVTMKVTDKEAIERYKKYPDVFEIQEDKTSKKDKKKADKKTAKKEEVVEETTETNEEEVVEAEKASE